RSSLRSCAIELCLRFGRLSFSLKPYASASRTRRRAPSLAPSGAKTELQECANDVASEPPHDSLLALASRTPDSTAPVCTGYALDTFAIPACSAPDSVTILN